MSKKSLTPVDTYVFNLSKELQALAEDELRESESTRTQAIKSLRDWIESNPRIELTRMDARFLLRFLRTKKFSVTMAQDNLERFILLRSAREGVLFTQMDFTMPKMIELLDLGLVTGF